MKVLGLTGGIASGKSAVAELLARQGGAVIDADALAREVVEPGTPALEAIVRRFGPGVLAASGRLDRAELGRRVFRDAAARADLNAIVHPAVHQAMIHELAKLAERVPPPRFAVLAVPLLYEAGMEGMADRVWVVSVPPEVQRERLIKRDGWTPTEADERIDSQWPLERKAALADRVIDNRGSLSELEAQVRRALEAEGWR